MPTIIQIDDRDPRTKAALDAEKRLFARYGLEYKVHFIEMREPNLRVRVLDIGTGQPIFLVPGGTGDTWYYFLLMAELKNWRIIAVNRPGGGLSDGIDHRQIDMRHFAVTTLRSVMDAFELNRVPIICNSMGGLWSFWFALDASERVSQLIALGCPALILNTTAPFLTRLFSVPGITHLIARNAQPKNIDTALDMLRSNGSPQEVIDAMPREAKEAAYYFYNLPTYINQRVSLNAAVVSVKGPNQKYPLRADELQRVQQPVLFVWGDNDPYGKLDVARQAVRIMPNAKLYEMHSGHMPFIDKPQESGRVIREFLSMEK
jgi:2-hydroxy-6-oxonona-2,4-dienedioate hydrolase